jgi:hypothetical protein
MRKQTSNIVSGIMSPVMKYTPVLVVMLPEAKFKNTRGMMVWGANQDRTPAGIAEYVAIHIVYSTVGDMIVKSHKQTIVATYIVKSTVGDVTNDNRQWTIYNRL